MYQKEEQVKVKAIVQDTIRLLLKSGLTFDAEINLEGVIGVTVDQKDVFIISLNEIIASEQKNIPKTELTEETDGLWKTSSRLGAEPDNSSDISLPKKRKRDGTTVQLLGKGTADEHGTQKDYKTDSLYKTAEGGGKPNLTDQTVVPSASQSTGNFVKTEPTDEDDDDCFVDEAASYNLMAPGVVDGVTGNQNNWLSDAKTAGLEQSSLMYNQRESASDWRINQLEISAMQVIW